MPFPPQPAPVLSSSRARQVDALTILIRFNMKTAPLRLLRQSGQPVFDFLNDVAYKGEKVLIGRDDQQQDKQDDPQPYDRQQNGGRPQE